MLLVHVDLVRPDIVAEHDAATLTPKFADFRTPIRGVMSQNGAFISAESPVKPRQKRVIAVKSGQNTGPANMGV